MQFTKLTKMCIEGRAEYGEYTFFLAPDVHFDNPKCDRVQFKKLLDQCVERNAYIIFNGDLFCLMQGRYDPRRARDSVRPEHNHNNYLDLVINDAAEFLAPYADRIALIGYGNHETNICKRLETDPIERLIERLHFMTSHKIMKSGYHGFLMLKFGALQNGKYNTVSSSVIYHHHGKFSGVISKGVLGVGRHGAVTPDADVILTGHTHDNWSMEQPRYRLSKRTGEVTIEPQIHLKSGTLKEEFAVPNGWAVETIVMPKSNAGWWINYHTKRLEKGGEINITYEPAR